MKNFKKPFVAAFDKLRAWYRERPVRRVFLVALLVFAVCMVFASVDSSGTITMVGIVSAIICIGASIGDTVISYRIFQTLFKQAQRNYFLQMAAIGGDSLAQQQQCFTPDELKRIKRKRMNYRTTIILKVFFIGILIALLFGMI